MQRRNPKNRIPALPAHTKQYCDDDFVDRDISYLTTEDVNSKRRQGLIVEAPRHSIIPADDVFNINTHSGGRGLDDEYSFDELKKQTRQIRATQNRIDTLLHIDSTGGAAKTRARIIDALKRFVGIRVQTLSEYLKEEEHQVTELCGLLSDLYSACDQHYQDLSSFRGRYNERLSRIAAMRPGLNQGSQRAREGYIQLSKSLSTLRRTDPEYFRVREQLLRQRDAVYQGQHLEATADDNFDLIENIAFRVDSITRVLLFGKHVVQQLGFKYKIVEECLREVSPGANFVKSFLRNAPLVYDLIKASSTAIHQAASIETRLENPRLMAKAYSEVPALPSHRGMTGVLDYVNSGFDSGGINTLLKK